MPVNNIGGRIGSPSSGTVGSVPFVGDTTLWAQDNAQLFWDDTNNRLGIGTAIPSAPFHVSKITSGDVARVNYVAAAAADYALSVFNGDGIRTFGIGSFLGYFEGQIFLTAPAAQGGGSGIVFNSGAGKQGIFQQDGVGNMVFRAHTASACGMYFDSGTDGIYFRSSALATLLTILNNGAISATGSITAANLSGTNTGNQTSIVGITGSLAEFNTALTGADFATGGGTATGTNSGDQTSIVGITGTLAQFNTALSDADFATGGGTVLGASSGTNTGDQSIFQTIAVAGQSNVVADTTTDTLTLVAGSNVTITTDATTDTITIAATAGSGTFAVTETEIDFGATPVSEASFTITDASMTTSKKILASMSYATPTGKDQDELEMDFLCLRAVAGTGNFTLYVTSVDESYLADKFKINYSYA